MGSCLSRAVDELDCGLKNFPLFIGNSENTFAEFK